MHNFKLLIFNTYAQRLSRNHNVQPSAYNYKGLICSSQLSKSTQNLQLIALYEEISAHSLMLNSSTANSQLETRNTQLLICNSQLTQLETHNSSQQTLHSTLNSQHSSSTYTLH
ncbi:hypothetical protein EQH57_0063 [Dictyocoela roeselum]|nr:hypothetical protein EQH57_0063 [Dictyocoela roeselum]